MQDPLTQRLILVLQSDPNNGQYIQHLLAQNQVQTQIVAIADADEALDFLYQRQAYATVQRPDLVLLDLDLKGDGYNLLATIKGDAHLRRIPTIVLTLSNQTDDIFSTYSAQGNCYIIRPSDRDQLAHIVRRIEEFWLNIVTLPQE